MRFALLLYRDERGSDALSTDESEELARGHDAFAAAVTASGSSVVAGEAFASDDAATTVRRRGQHLAVREGPFAATAERLDGLYLLEAPDLDVVCELVRALPECTVEIRPVVDVGSG